MFEGFDLRGKTAVLTGATAGMGRALAVALLKHGARVVISSHSEEEMKQAVEELKQFGIVTGVKCDVTDADDLGFFAERVYGQIERVDSLYCFAAAKPPSGPIDSLNVEEFLSLLQHTVVGTFSLIRSFLPKMVERRDGSIVVMSSIASIRANSILGGYGASKAALNSIVRSIAAEYGQYNIRANAIAPSIVKTEFSKAIWENPELEKMMLAKIPVRRLADVEDIVGPALLLGSPAGRYINGQVILIDGGRSII